MYPTLTKRQKEILDYIKVFTELNGYAPSLVDVKSHFQLSAISTVHEHIQNLKDKGYIHKEMNQARSVRPIDPKLGNKDFVEVPLLGSLIDGQRLNLEKALKTYLLHKHTVTKDGKYFAVKIGTSEMKEAGFEEEDLLIFKEQAIAKEGEFVLVELDKDRTVFRKYLLNKNRITLEEQDSNKDKKYYKDIAIKATLAVLIRNYD